MQIQVNTDRNVGRYAALSADISGTVEDALGRYGDNITRVEIHLSDKNGISKHNGHDDMRCLIEARLKGRLPIAVIHYAETIDQAVSGAADKLTRSLEGARVRVRRHHS